MTFIAFAILEIEMLIVGKINVLIGTEIEILLLPVATHAVIATIQVARHFHRVAIWVIVIHGLMNGILTVSLDILLGLKIHSSIKRQVVVS